MAQYNGDYENYRAGAYREQGMGPRRAAVAKPATVPAPQPLQNPAATYNPAWTATLPASGQAPAGSPVPYEGRQAPINSVVGLSPEERQRIYNQARANFMGTTGAAVGSMTNTMGARGFVPGQSGIADSAVGKLWSEGLKGYGTEATAIATDEAKNRFNQGFNIDQLRAQQNQWAQEFGAGRMDKSTEELLAYMNLMQGSQLGQYTPYWNAQGGANLSEANYGGK